ncbi:MAG: hypothetical protein OEX18_15085 [Candidatus Krumholzibacteria bacterium]|nr:hypothetical protein [Candidatus Krumholzibacteria bacterium]MDH4038271.1 hypothetical protein [Candidatus Krumholzibacteria bacterium]MDH4338592.1 hypothetical protein [Candidatus Krumholzibacteria bacterium]MDH5270731.1 hypothetical protein [Candidatus Krumholzibacteria bacterium]
MTPKILILAAFAGLLLVGTAPARTWYVAADGSGDAPTIAAAVDSSASGDVILVGPGTHFVSDAAGSGVLLKAGTSLVSEEGPASTVLKPGNPPQPGLVSTRDNCVVSGFTVLGAGLIGAVSPVHIGGDFVEVSNNIIDSAFSGAPSITLGGTFVSIHNNACLGTGSGLYLVANPEGAEIRNNIILNGVEGGESCFGVQIHCNLINGSQGACPYRFNNFSGDPMFCGEGNYYLQSDSPCAPGNHPDGVDCGLIGPLPVGCGPVRTEMKTWGGVKAIYRE